MIDLLKIILPKANRGRFLDLGCGRGQDALLAAENGFQVEAVDRSEEAIGSIKEYLADHPKLKSKIKLFAEDIREFNIEKNKYQVINVSHSLQFLSRSDGLGILAKIKNGLAVGGYAVIAGFTVGDPLFKKPANKNNCFFQPGELKNLFSEFEIVFYKEKTIDDPPHKGYLAPHQHHIVQLIAKKLR